MNITALITGRGPPCRWWLNHPIAAFPQWIGVKMINIWNHHRLVNLTMVFAWERRAWPFVLNRDAALHDSWYSYVQCFDCSIYVVHACLYLIDVYWYNLPLSTKGVLHLYKLSWQLWNTWIARFDHFLKFCLLVLPTSAAKSGKVFGDPHDFKISWTS